MPRVARNPADFEVQPLQPVFRDAGAPPDAFGAGIGAGLGRVAAAVARAAERQAQDRDAQEIVARENDLSGLETDLTLGEQGAFTKQGANARGVTAQTLEAWDRRFQEILAKAGNDRQRVYLEGMGGRRRAALERELLRHETGESTKAEIQVYDTRVAQGLDEAIRKAGDPDAIEEILKGVEPVVRARGIRMGQEPDVVSDAVRTARSAAYAGAIASLLNRTETAAAQALYAKVKDQLSAEDLARLEKPLTIASDLAIEQREEDRIAAAARGDDGRIDLGRALDLTRDPKLDPVLRDRLDDRIRRRVADEQADKAQEDARIFDEADRQFVRSGGRVAAIAPTLLAGLTSEKLDYFRRMEQAAIARRVDIEPYQVSKETWGDWWSYEQLPPAEKVGIDLKVRFKGLLPNSMWAQMVEQQAAYRVGLAKEDAKPDKYTRFQSAHEAIVEAAKRAAIYPKETSGDEEKARYAVFQSKAMAGIRKIEEEKYGGKQAATEDDVQAVIDRMLVKGEVEGRFWNATKLAFEVEGGPFGVAEVDAQPFLVPPSARTRIEQRLKEHGSAVTEQAVRQVYLEALAKGLPKP